MSEYSASLTQKIKLLLKEIYYFQLEQLSHDILYLFKIISGLLKNICHVSMQFCIQVLSIVYIYIYIDLFFLFFNTKIFTLIIC